MAIYGKETPLTFTPLSLFNPTTAQMVLSSMNNYAAALKDRYEQAHKDQLNFIDEYKNYISPSAADTKFVRDNTVGTVINEIENLYRQGVDPLRSGEGISRLRYLMNKLKTGPIQERILSSENMNEYLSNVAKAKLAGTFSQELEDARLNGKNPLNWNTATDGIWQEKAPVKYEDPVDVVSNVYKNAKADSYLGDDPNNKDRYLMGLSKDTKQNLEVAAVNALRQSPTYPLLKKQILDLLKGQASSYDEKTGELIFIDQDGNATVDNIDDDKLINGELLNVVREIGAPYTQEKSVLKEEAAAKIKASYKASSKSGSGGGGSKTNNIKHENVIAGSIQNHLKYINSSILGNDNNTPFDVVYNQGDPFKNSNLNVRIDPVVINNYISGTNNDFFPSIGNLTLFRTESEAKGNNTNQDGDKKRDSLTQMIIKDDKRVFASSTGNIKLVRNGSQIIPYAEIQVGWYNNVPKKDLNGNTVMKDGVPVMVKDPKHRLYYYPIDYIFDNNYGESITVDPRSAGSRDYRASTKTGSVKKAREEEYTARTNTEYVEEE